MIEYINGKGTVEQPFLIRKSQLVNVERMREIHNHHYKNTTV